jgi:hypothetical protein
MSRVIGWASVVLSLLAILPSLISGVGFAMVFLGLVLAGVAAALGQTKLALVSFIISVVNVFGFSVFTLMPDSWSSKSLLMLAILYSPLMIGLLIGYLRGARAKARFEKDR